MNKEWQLLEGRLDATHEFIGADYECTGCGKPRALHYYDGFVPNPSPGRLGQDAQGHFAVDPNVRFKGTHPRFNKVGKPIVLKKEEFSPKGRKALGI